MRAMSSRVPFTGKGILRKIPPHFRDDGCSNSPDRWMGWDLRWACRIHDWRYCTRAHRAGTMTALRRARADKELRLNLRAFLPWRWRWLGWAYYVGVWRYGGMGSWDSCDATAGKLCRHNMPMPEWMVYYAAELEG